MSDFCLVGPIIRPLAHPAYGVLETQRNKLISLIQVLILLLLEMAIYNGKSKLKQLC